MPDAAKRHSPELLDFLDETADWDEARAAALERSIVEVDETWPPTTLTWPVASTPPTARRSEPGRPACTSSPWGD